MPTRRMPNAPSFIRTPAWSMETPVGAATWPSGDQVCSGHMPASTPKPIMKNGKHHFWKSSSYWHLAQHRHVERAGARFVEDGEDADEDQHRSGDQHQRQLHRAVFLGAREGAEVGAGAPDGDQQVHRQHGHLVPEEEEEEVFGDEDAVDARDQQEEQDEEVLRAGS